MDNISAVKDKIDIVDLIGSYVQLKKAGKNYRSLCPFHSEKTPSFMVSPDLQSYRCFGCGKSGDIFNFIMDMEGMDFSESLKMLADKAGVELKHDKKAAKESDKRQKIIEANNLSANFYHQILTKHEYGKPVLEYLEDRGIKLASIKEFNLGYAPKSWEALSKMLVKRGFTLDEITEAGLVKYRKDNKSTYDMFRGRLMIPLFDHMERCVGFSGRALSKDQEPKYINTPESLVFHKERYVYGLNKSKASIRQKNTAILVEGPFDMISPYQAGIKNIVATQGTALTLAQIKLIKRYAEEAVLIFDNDSAGMEAAVRGVQVVQNSDINLKIAIIEGKYKDPDEMAQGDPRAFKELIKNALPLWDFYFVYSRKKFDFEDVFQKKRAGEFLLSAISEIKNEVVKSEYVKKFAQVFEMNEDKVLDELTKAKSSGRLSSRFSAVAKQTASADQLSNKAYIESYPKSEVYLLALITKAENDKLPFYMDSVEPDYFSNSDIAKLTENMKSAVKSTKKFETKAFYDKMTANQPNFKVLLETIYLLDLEDYLYDSDRLDKEITSTLQRLKAGHLKRRLKQISKDIAQAEGLSDSAKVQKLQKEAAECSQELVNITS